MNIELYSVKGFTGSALKKKLETALEQRHLSFTIVEINHVDEFIKAGLVSVPAFKIGEKIIQHPQNGSPDETVSKVMDYLLEEKYNTILVPVDFSEESNHAIQYATMIARQFQMGLTLVHIHQTMYDPVSAGALDMQFMEETRKQLSQLVNSLNKENESKNLRVPVVAHMEVGETSSSLIELLKHGKYTLLIMGTKAIDNAVRRIFGTISSEVGRHSSKPVMVIPPQAEIRFPGKMVVGFTEELLNDHTLEYLLHFGAKNNVFFDFVRVTDDPVEFNSLKNKLYEKLIIHRNLLSGFNIRSVSEEEHKIHEALFSYAQEVRANILVLVSHHRNFLENISHSSVTKKALHHPPLPLMIIHQPIDVTIE